MQKFLHGLTLLSLLAISFLRSSPRLVAADARVGVFSGHGDLGGPKRAGGAEFDSGTGSYKVSGGGKNMWFTNDALHFVWRKLSGNAGLVADITFQGTGGDAHRKACLLIRQNLETDGAYADAALHGDGLTSLQYRETNGATTREIQSNVTGPRRLRIEKRGQYVSMSVALGGEPLHPAGGSFRLDLADPFYVGLGVCAHNDDALETAVFLNLELTEGAVPPHAPLISTLETITLSSKDRRVVWWTTNLIEAPNWSRDGASLYFNSKGRILRVAPAGGEPEMVDTGFAIRCNNDHGLSPDGQQLVISDQSQGNHRSLIYTLPLGGGTPRRLTDKGPSYWHGWSPDGQTLAFCGKRNGEFDIYTIPASGGVETRLTTAPGLDDGPDYSPDGQFIYFNSDRTSRMQVWRMRADGSQQEQVTKDEWNNWFPHPSPDGKSLVLLSYAPDVQGHPENKDVLLRVLTLATGKTEVIAKLFGGQGTINVPSWSPDSRKLAFVSYQR